MSADVNKVMKRNLLQMYFASGASTTVNSLNIMLTLSVMMKQIYFSWKSPDDHLAFKWAWGTVNVFFYLTCFRDSTECISQRFGGWLWYTKGVNFCVC